MSTQDDEKQKEVNRKLADAEFEQGVAHHKTREYMKASNCFKNAADKGHAQAQYIYATILHAGRPSIGGSPGIMSGSADAVGYYESAAIQGHIGAQYKLGVIYDNEQLGVQRDISTLLRWYRMAANGGHPEAQFKLYRELNDDLESKKEALYWLQLALNQGHEGAKKTFEGLKLSPRLGIYGYIYT